MNDRMFDFMPLFGYTNQYTWYSYKAHQRGEHDNQYIF